MPSPAVRLRFAPPSVLRYCLCLVLLFAQHQVLTHALVHWQAERAAETAASTQSSQRQAPLPHEHSACAQCVAVAAAGAALCAASFCLALAHLGASPLVRTPVAFITRVGRIYRSRDPPVLV